MKKKTVIIIGLVLAIIAISMGLLRLFSGEDNWICQNGSWVKHGNPVASAPTTECK